MPKEYALTDIHGCYRTFRYMIEELMQPDRTDHIYLLGDYINKGPSSKAVLDYIFDLREAGYQVTTLMGNHEKYLIDALYDKNRFFTFIDKGGSFTLKDFGVDRIGDIPQKYLDFMGSLDYYVEKQQVILVHAGFNFDRADPFSDKEAMLNIREMNIGRRFGNKKIVHGHVPTKLSRILAALHNPTSRNISLDGGCVYPHREGLGFLVGLELTSWEVFVKECLDPIPEKPA